MVTSEGSFSGASASPQLLAGATESRAHRADREAERLGDLLVAEVGPDEQEQGVSLLGAELGERAGDPAVPDGSGDPCAGSTPVR